MMPGPVIDGTTRHQRVTQSLIYFLKKLGLVREDDVHMKGLLVSQSVRDAYNHRVKLARGVKQKAYVNRMLKRSAHGPR